MLTKWIIDGRKKPWPTSELFVGYDSHESVRRGQKLRPRLVHASIARGIIAIGNTEADGVRMLYTIGSVDQIKRALVELALEDKSNDEESFNYGTEDISDVEETVDSKTNDVTVLNAYNVFSDYHRRTVEPSVSGTREHSSRYHIDYTAQRLDSMQMPDCSAQINLAGSQKRTG